MRRRSVGGQSERGVEAGNRGSAAVEMQRGKTFQGHIGWDRPFSLGCMVRVRVCDAAVMLLGQDRQDRERIAGMRTCNLTPDKSLDGGWRRRLGVMHVAAQVRMWGIGWVPACLDWPADPGMTHGLFRG